jgi:type IV secretion system protein VirD4
MSDENRIYWIAGAAAATVLAILWLTGAVAGALFGSGWAPIHLDQLLFAAIRLPSHLDSPRAAWPRGVARELPGPLGFYTALALVLAASAGLAWAVKACVDRLGIGLPLSFHERRPPSARMASRRDLRPLRVPSPQPGRLTLGRRGGMLLATEERQSVIVFAPTQTFKTTGFAIPALLEWEGPVLATTVKNDLIADTLARRESLGKVAIFDPARATDMPRSRITPLWGATTWRGAVRVGGWLMSAARLGRSSGMQDADFWFAAAEKLVCPLLFAAATNGETMATVVRWLDEGPEASEAEVTELLRESGVAEAQRQWKATLNREERQRSSIYTTAEIALAAFADPNVLEETAGADYTPSMLFDGGANTLFLSAPRMEQERLRPLFSNVVQEHLALAEALFAETEKPLDPPWLLLLDEAANIAPVPHLDQVAATVAGQGVQLLSIFQDLSQAEVIYGPRASSIVNNHAAKFVGSGIADRKTTAFFSGVIGAGQFEQKSRTAGEKGRRSTTEGETYRDLAPPSVLREAKPGTGHLVYRHLPPTNISLRPWFEERKLRELQQVSKGQPSSEGGGA